jgi:hypothetical protein
MTAVLHSIHVTDKTGDVETTWHRGNRDEVAAAKAAFDHAQENGMLIYKTDRRGNKGEQMRTWDPTAEKIIAVPQYQGG